MLAEQPQGHVTTPIMPARPLCYGSLLVEEGYPACLICMCDHECASTAANWWWKTHRYAYLAQPLIRVYARENHELRERVEALEWLREVEDFRNNIISTWAPERRKTWRGAYREILLTMHNARKEAGDER